MDSIDKYMELIFEALQLWIENAKNKYNLNKISNPLFEFSDNLLAQAKDYDKLGSKKFGQAKKQAKELGVNAKMELGAATNAVQIAEVLIRDYY